MADRDDRTTKARIRDAAIVLIAKHPSGSVTARDVAAEAGVSPGSVIHHYESMDGLRRACNEYVAAIVRDYKREAVDGSHPLDLLAALRSVGDLPVAAYLASVVTETSPVVDALVDGLVDDAVEYMRFGVEQGTIRSTDDERGRATVLVLWSLGGLALHHHFARLLGVDIADPSTMAGPGAAAYATPALELMARGAFTDSFAKEIDAAIHAAFD